VRFYVDYKNIAEYTEYTGIYTGNFYYADMLTLVEI